MIWFRLVMLILALLCVVAAGLIIFSVLILCIPLLPVFIVPFLIWFYGKETKYDRKIMEKLVKI